MLLHKKHTSHFDKAILHGEAAPTPVWWSANTPPKTCMGNPEMTKCARMRLRFSLEGCRNFLFMVQQIYFIAPHAEACAEVCETCANECDSIALATVRSVLKLAAPLLKPIARLQKLRLQPSCFFLYG